MPDSADPLVLNAMLYASGELDASAALAFEERLADDQSARDALAQAVQLSLILSGRPQRPDSAYRDRVRDAVSRVSWWAWLCKPRLRRGPTFAWVGLGSAAAVLFMFLSEPTPVPTFEPEVVVAKTAESVTPPVVAPVEQVAVQTEPMEVVPETNSDMASMWEEMSNTDRLQRVHDEEQRRRQARSKERYRPGDGDSSSGRVLGNSSRGER